MPYVDVLIRHADAILLLPPTPASQHYFVYATFADAVIVATRYYDGLRRLRDATRAQCFRACRMIYTLINKTRAARERGY